MTITLELTPEQEEQLNESARQAGVESAEVVLQLIAGLKSEPKGLLPGESVLDAMKRIGVAGAFRSKPRPDGRPWSEIEGYEFE